MTAIYWAIYVLAMFGLGGMLAHLTCKQLPKKVPTNHTPEAQQSIMLDLDFTTFESKEYDY